MTGFKVACSVALCWKMGAWQPLFLLLDAFCIVKCFPIHGNVCIAPDPLNIAVCFDWVDSDSNVAEGFSKMAKTPFGLWIILREFQGLPFTVSLVSLRGQHFQSC